MRGVGGMLRGGSLRGILVWVCAEAGMGSGYGYGYEASEAGMLRTQRWKAPMALRVASAGHSYVGVGMRKS